MREGTIITDDRISRIPPHDLSAEQAILGALLLEGAQALPHVAQKLLPEDFFKEHHRSIYSAILTLGAGGQAIDPLTVAAELRRQDQLADVGGAGALALLVEQAAIAVHLDAYISLVRDAAARREIIRDATGLIAQAFDARDTAQDLVERGRTLFERIAARAVVAEKAFQALTLAQLLRLQIPDPTFLVDGWIPEAALSFVVGDSETFKSWFTAYLGLCIASGRPLFDRIPVRRVPVLLISEENGLPEDRRRLSLMQRGMGFDPALEDFHVASETSFSFDDPAKYAAMRAYIDEHRIRLVIIDSFVRVHRREEKDAGEMNALYLDRIKPLVRAGVAMLLLHHRRKLPSGVVQAQQSDNDDIRGSGDIRAAAHAVLFLRTASDTKVVVKHNKARGWKKQEPFVFGIADVDTGGVVLTHEGKPEDVLDKRGACREAILLFARDKGTFPRGELERHLKGKFSKKVFEPVLKDLSAADYPLKKDKVGREVLYHFVSGEPSADPREDTTDDVPF